MNPADSSGADYNPLSAETKRREAALYLFREYIGQMQAQSVAWQKARDEVSLHQFRVSLRRCRVLLRVFAVDADAHGGKSLRLALTRAADKLGAVRDMDVIHALIKKSSYCRCGRNDVELAPLLLIVARQRDVHLHRAEKYLGGNSQTRIAELTGSFLNRWISGANPEDEQTIKIFLDREFRLHCRWIMRAEWMAKSDTPETLHAFRIKLRRLRYLGDLLNVIADGDQKKVFKRIHSCEQELGQVHDIDMTLELMDVHPLKTPDALRREVQSLRVKKLGKFLKKWRKCRKILRDQSPVARRL